MIVFEHKSFESLTHYEIFSMYQLRVAVFVVEQECPYQEVDEIDLSATHIFGKNQEGELITYMRVYLESGVWHIGRVIARKDVRRFNYGRNLVEYGLSLIPSNQLIKAQAQHYLQHFYASFGFKPVSDVYLEDNIPHIDMEYIKA